MSTEPAKTSEGEAMPSSLRLRWQRAWPDNDNHFVAYDPKHCGESVVVHIYRAQFADLDRVSWRWGCNPPGAMNVMAAHELSGQDDEARVAARAAEAAYATFLEVIDPDELARQVAYAQYVIEGHRLWAEKHGPAVKDGGGSCAISTTSASARRRSST